MSSNVSGQSRSDLNRELSNIPAIYAVEASTSYTLGLDKPLIFPQNIVPVGVIITQRSSAPLAAEIGGAPGANNFMLAVVSNKLMSYQCDGTTVTAKQLAP